MKTNFCLDIYLILGLHIHLAFPFFKVLKVFDNSRYTHVTLIDLQKTFHTIDHDIYFYKLAPLDFFPKPLSFSNLIFQTDLMLWKSKIDIQVGFKFFFSFFLIFLGSAFCLIFDNDTAQVIQSDLLFCANSWSLTFQYPDIREIEHTLEMFGSLKTGLFTIYLTLSFFMTVISIIF